MINIFVHGLGQTEQSWNKVIEKLNKSNIKVSNPSLFNLSKNYQINYENIYRTFADYCDSFKDKPHKDKFMWFIFMWYISY